jgi:hypothetical protein
MSARKHAPRNGLARALMEADPSKVPGNVPEILRDVERWECTGCEKHRFTCPERCSCCGDTQYRKVVPATRNA